MTNFVLMVCVMFCFIFRSLSSDSSAGLSPVTGPVETYTLLLLCGVRVGVLEYNIGKKGSFRSEMLASVHGL